MRTPLFRPLWRALLIGLAGLTAASPGLAQITFYEHDGFRGRSYTTAIPVSDLQGRGFNDRASSAVVTSDRWEICEDVRFQGRCTVLRPGQYPSLSAMGLNDRVSSVRSVVRRAQLEESQYAPHPEVVGDFRRRDNERLFEAPVSATRAVFGAPEQRCWVDRGQVSESRGDTRMPGAILGAVIGGILSHQIGTGSGIAPVGGVVGGVGGGLGGGAAVGSNINRKPDGSRHVTRDVPRCTSSPPAAAPAYWDVTYNFRGQEHHVQLMAAPGRTITVNLLGEPRA